MHTGLSAVPDLKGKDLMSSWAACGRLKLRFRRQHDGVRRFRAQVSDRFRRHLLGAERGWLPYEYPVQAAIDKPPICSDRQQLLIVQCQACSNISVMHRQCDCSVETSVSCQHQPWHQGSMQAAAVLCWDASQHTSVHCHSVHPLALVPCEPDLTREVEAQVAAAGSMEANVQQPRSRGKSFDALDGHVKGVLHTRVWPACSRRAHFAS